MGKLTGQTGHEEAIKAALNIVAVARVEVKRTGGENFFFAGMDVDESKKKEEELLLGN